MTKKISIISAIMLGGWLFMLGCNDALANSYPFSSPSTVGPKGGNLDINEVKLLILKADQLKASGAYGQAAAIWQGLVELTEKQLGPNNPATAHSINNLAWLYQAQGLYGKALPLFEKALAIKEKILGPEDPGTAISLDNLAGLYQRQGFYGQAEALYVRALKIREKKLGPHPDTATSLNNLAGLYSRQSSYNKAEPLYLRALAINESLLGPDHLDISYIVNDLALLYLKQGLFSKAEPLLLRALSISERILGRENPETASILNNLAGLYNKQGLYEKAEPFFLQALAIREKILGAWHPDTANTLHNFASFYMNKALYSKAELLYLRALDINKKRLGAEDLVTANSLDSLAGLYLQEGSYAKAEPLFEMALRIREKKLGLAHLDVADSLNNLAGLYGRQGFYRKSEALYVKSLAINSSVLSADNARTASSLLGLAWIYNAKGSYKRSSEYAMKGLTIQASLIKREAPFLPLSYRIPYLTSLGAAYEAVFSYAYSDSARANLLLFARLNRQGILEEIEKNQARLASLPGPQQKTSAELTAINRQVSSPSLTSQQRKILKVRQEELEAQLYRLLPELKPRIVDVKQVASALPSTGALVEYQRYQPFDGKKPNSQRWGKPRYLALVLKANGSVTAIDLGPAGVIEERIQQALRATQEQLSDANQLWGRVGKQVLDPLAPALTGVQTLFVSPDGELNRIPFAAMPAPGGKALLADALQLRLLTTGRELLDLAQPRSQAKTAALVVANPAFDQLASNTSVPAVRPADPVESPFGTGGQQRSADLATLRWSALPATAKEGEAIAALTGATLLSGSQASATAIEKQAAPRILHIASHGYFLANQPASPPGKRSSSNSGLPPMGSLPAANLQAESPLLRSGIVLAGANKVAAGASVSNSDRGDDGYLTALEITQLDWKGTELVVISACESGKGDIQAGEGVYGLKRAIAVAGARSSLLSLWKVDDAATAAFMQSFYEKLKTGQGRADALATTQREFRNHSIPGWRHPYVWAAFQLSGDWGPVPGI